jgi:hypothetical protein
MIFSLSLLLTVLSAQPSSANLDPQKKACVEACYATYDRPSYDLKLCVTKCLK